MIKKKGYLVCFSSVHDISNVVNILYFNFFIFPVAKQCLETAYGVSLDNTHLSTGRPLMDIFCEGSGLSQVSSSV